MEKVIPNRDLRLDEMPIAPWNSAGYEDCYDDLEKGRGEVPPPARRPDQGSDAGRVGRCSTNGRSKWYGIKGFFEWLETKKYKIHVRVKLAKYRSYEPCPQCHGSRLKIVGVVREVSRT